MFFDKNSVWNKAFSLVKEYFCLNIKYKRPKNGGRGQKSSFKNVRKLSIFFLIAWGPYIPGEKNNLSHTHIY